MLLLAKGRKFSSRINDLIILKYLLIMFKKTIIIVVILLTLLGPNITLALTAEQNNQYAAILAKISSLLEELKRLMETNTNITPVVNQPAIILPTNPSTAITNQALTLSLNTPVVNSALELEFNLSEIGTDYANIDINYSGHNNYEGFRWDPGNTGWRPNPSLYPEYYQGSDLLRGAQRVYRMHKLCDGTTEMWSTADASPQALAVDPDFVSHFVGKPHNEILELAGGYTNYVCRNRYQQQCIDDGSFDKYYDERCDFGKVKFTLGETKWGPNFGIKLSEVNADTQQITIEILNRDNTTTVVPGRITLMKTANNPGVYAVDEKNKTKSPIVDPTILTAYKLKLQQVKIVPQKIIEALKNQKPVGLPNESLVKASNQSTVYQVDNGLLRPVESITAAQSKDIKVVTPKVLNMYQIVPTAE